MKYIGTPTHVHGSDERLGVLMVNLGTPKAPETPQVRRYLAEFLSDPRIIELPRWIWNILLHGVILRIRPPRSAKAYREVWSDDEGSPLLSISRRQETALRSELTRRFGEHVVVALGMRYGTPSIDSAIGELEAAGVRRLIVLPMYPQYSGTTTASVFDAVTSRLQRTRWIPEMRFINQFCDEDGFVDALAASVRESWETHGRGELLVTSYHGIPKRYLTNGDPYHCLCHKTSRLLAEHLGIGADGIRVVFQSRVGREEWLRPYCDETMKTLPSEGITSIDVLCPAFSADCLETIEEISGENREYFEEHGGERFRYIPCLNDRADHVSFLGDLVERHAQGWPEADHARDRARIEHERLATAARAVALKASQPANTEPEGRERADREEEELAARYAETTAGDAASRAQAAPSMQAPSARAPSAPTEPARVGAAQTASAHAASAHAASAHAAAASRASSSSAPSAEAASAEPRPAGESSAGGVVHAPGEAQSPESGPEATRDPVEVSPTAGSATNP